VQFDLDGMVFVITGSAGGMGAATARMAAGNGARVVVTDLQDEQGAAVVDDIKSAGGEAIYCRCDLGEPDDIERLMARAAEAFGGVDVVHNNAAVTDVVVAGRGDAPTIETISPEHWDRVMAINLRAPFLTAKAALPYLKESARPSILNVVSVGGLVARPNTPAYGPSKAGVAQLTRTLAFEFRNYGIRVNGYAPGYVETPLSKQHFDRAPGGAERRRAMLEGYLCEEAGTIEQVAAFACFLASPSAAFINGTVVAVDGGFMAWKASPGEMD
jgi:NAD(P)-dependent dehydrogenase (short-subunit alcohol dehydrogenase family)